jgi:hypothetical protein
MPRSLRRHLSYANVAATLALFLSVTAGAYAATRITGKEVVNGSITGKDIREESIRSKHVRGLSLADLQNGPGQYYLRNASGQGSGLAEATATCNNNDVAISGGTASGGVSTYLLANGPGPLNQSTRTVTSWSGRVAGTSGSQQVNVTVTALCMVVPAG